MKQRQSAGLFLVLNVIVSIVVAVGVLTLYSSLQEEEAPRALPATLILVVTATPNPNQPLAADVIQQTADSLALTVTAYARDSFAAQPGGSGTIPTQPAGSAPSVPSSSDDLPTLDPALIPSLPSSLSTVVVASALPDDGCERYYVQSGDVTGAIATRYGVDLSDLLVLNGINDQTILQVGQELLIPSPNCEPNRPPTETPTPRPTFNLTIVAPTATLAPTAENAQVVITEILNPGDITAEEVVIQNLGGELDMQGWTLSDGQGNIFTFPAIRLVPGSVIRVLTRTGNNTPGFLYWNQNSPIWELGESASLTDSNGALQSVQTVGGAIIDFVTPGGN